MTILEKVVTTMQQLPIDQQQQVLRFIEFLVFELKFIVKTVMRRFLSFNHDRLSEASSFGEI